MYAIKRITKEYDGATGKFVEKQKIVSCIKKKYEADEKLIELDLEMQEDKVKFTQLEQQYVGEFGGSTARFKEANPEGYDFFTKFRNSGSENFLKHEIETVGKW